jgi:hypothetical protein
VLAHAEIIVGAPDHDIAGAVGAVPFRAWKAAGMALKVGEYPIAALVVQFRQSFGEIGLIIHTLRPFPASLAAFFRRVPRPLSRRDFGCAAI